MKSIEITGAVREGVGKSAMKKVRRQELIPGTVYGLGDPENVSVGYIDLEKAINTPETYIVNLDINGKKTATVIRETQFHPVTDRILHVDFLRVSDDQPVEVGLPIKLIGTPEGVLGGGKLVPLLRRLKVRGLISKLPDSVEIDVTNLLLGETITVEKANIEGLEVTSPGSSGVAMVDIPRAVRQAQDGETEGEAEGEAAAE